MERGSKQQRCSTTSDMSNPDAGRLLPRPTRWAEVEGSPSPLGATWIEDQQAYNFALYSKAARRVTLLFYRDDDFRRPALSYTFDPLANKSGPIWHCRLSIEQLAGMHYYGYHVDGPSDDPRNIFEPEKILLDPYCTSVFFPASFDRHAAAQPGSNAGEAPLGLIDACRCEFSWAGARPPRHDCDLIIYEMHVRGFTRHRSSGVRDAKQGTFAGVTEKIPYLQELGVTAVELMPIFQFDPQEGNYWGYMPINFFSPHHDYSADPHICRQHYEFREMVRSLHEAGIEVILDVVYNHTGEGNEAGPTYSFKGIDNGTYYILTDDRAAPYANFSGTGNTLRTSHRTVRQLIADSLRYWAGEMGVDGFRFDLASIFARTGNGAINTEDPALFGQIASDPALRDVRLIAEPWDAGGLYQLGRHFPGTLWMQWNGRYRDAIQQFVRGDGGWVAEMMTRLYGSSDLFPDDPEYSLRPFQSVNYVTSHDGSTLYDLVSYEQKRNWANGHDNTDGSEEARWNCGWEGDRDVPAAVLRLRKQQVKNFFCLLMLSAGTPMFRMGDEFLQTQGGNNNPFNQDNETTWLDWRRLESHRDVFRFFRLMIAFRKRHPSLARSRFWREDIAWHGPRGPVDWSRQSRSLAFCLHGGSAEDIDLYAMIHTGDQPMRFEVAERPDGGWKRAVDTALPSPDDIAEDAWEARVEQDHYTLQPHSVVVLVGGGL